MNHSMKLSQEPFEDIINRTKSIEIRLFDEKRRQLNLGDIIEFSKLPELKQKVRVRILGLLIYQSFEQLLNDFPTESFGSGYSSKQELLDSIYQIYSREEEQKYGVLGIKIEIL